LVTKPMASIGKVSKGTGNIVDGSFQLSGTPQPVQLSGNEKADHLHFTYHPSIRKTTPVLNGVARQSFAPRFNLCNITRLAEVVRHQLATPQAYPNEHPKADEDGQYHAVLKDVYGGMCQPTVTFWVAPINRSSNEIPDALIVPECFIYVRVSPQRLPIDVLIQAKLTYSKYTSAGDVHIMAAAVAE
jgi:hypothetical protein